MQRRQFIERTALGLAAPQFASKPTRTAASIAGFNQERVAVDGRILYSRKHVEARIRPKIGIANLLLAPPRFQKVSLLEVPIELCAS